MGKILVILFYGASVRKISTSVALAVHVRISNVWLLEAAPGVKLLFDTGHFAERYSLLASLWAANIRKPGDLSGVILTHRHSDHAGNAAWLKARFHCPVFCHEGDAPILNGEAVAAPMARPELPLLDRFFCHIEDRFPARVSIDEALSEGGWRYGLRVLSAPGHTPGSALFYHEPTKALFSGDSILAGPPVIRLVEKPRFAAWEYSEDVAQAHQSTARRLRELPAVSVMCSGHGPAITRNTAQKLLALAG